LIFAAHPIKLHFSGLPLIEFRAYYVWGWYGGWLVKQSKRLLNNIIACTGPYAMLMPPTICPTLVCMCTSQGVSSKPRTNWK